LRFLSLRRIFRNNTVSRNTIASPPSIAAVHYTIRHSSTMDYTSYGAQGGANGGGFMPDGSQGGDNATAKKGYGKDTLRPVTIKQLLDAHHPQPDADHFMIDNAEATQVTLVGQVRNISTQTTNVTYKLDDGTGIIEVKVWIDSDAADNPNDPANQKAKPVEQAYARAWGRLKTFGSKRHVGATVIRPITDLNEVSYHFSMRRRCICFTPEAHRSRCRDRMEPMA